MNIKSIAAVALWVPLVAVGQTYYGAGGEVTGYRLLYPNGAATYYDAQSRVIGSQSAPYVEPSGRSVQRNAVEITDFSNRDNVAPFTGYLLPLLIDPTR